MIALRTAAEIAAARISPVRAEAGTPDSRNTRITPSVLLRKRTGTQSKGLASPHSGVSTSGSKRESRSGASVATSRPV